MTKAAAAFLTLAAMAMLATAVDICDVDAGKIYCECRKRSVMCTIYGNILPNVTEWSQISGLENVEVFTIRTMSGISIDGIPNIPGLEHIRILDVELTGLTRLNISKGFDKLAQLDLQGNGILNISVSNLPELSELKLDDNGLVAISPQTFTNLPSLSKLFILNNNISRIDDCAFCNVTSLSEIELLGNKLSSIESGTFHKLTELRNLDLMQNQISTISDYAFRDLNNLRELNLKNNKITSLSSKTFEGLSKLVFLRLDENRMKIVPDHLFRGLSNLMSLDLSENQLTHLPVSIINDLPQSTVMSFNFFFKRNPLECSCGLKWIAEYRRRVTSTAFKEELKAVRCKVVDETVFRGANITIGHTVKLSHFDLQCEAPAPGSLVDKMKGSPQYVDEKASPSSAPRGILDSQAFLIATMLYLIL